MTASALYTGRIRHRRTAGPRHTFTYRVWSALIDLDEVEQLARRLPIFAHNRFNVLSFHDKDHLQQGAMPLRQKLARWLLEEHDERLPDGPVLLLTNLRQLGYVFNPVSFFYCYEADGTLRTVVAEVNNTFGERYCYRLHGHTEPSQRAIRETVAKVFHVSPFQPLHGEYRFHLTPPGERLVTHIELHRDGGLAMDATFSAKRRPLTTSSLLATLMRHPHVTVHTISMIHWQALRLWLKRAPFHSKPEPPSTAWRTRHG